MPERNSLTDNDLANWARVAIATEYANAGKFEQAAQLADTIQAKMQPDSANPVETALKNRTLAALALVYAQAARFPQALQIAPTIQPVAVKDQILIAIAKQQAKAGQYSNAIQVAKTINDARQREPLLQLLTCGQRVADSRQLSRSAAKSNLRKSR